jgi:hypothetical protein
MATDKLDIIISVQREQSAQLAQIIGTSGEHSAEIRALRAGLDRIERRCDGACKPVLDAATAGDIAVAVNSGKISAKLVIFIVTAIATAVATALGAALGAQ